MLKAAQEMLAPQVKEESGETNPLAPKPAQPVNQEEQVRRDTRTLQALETEIKDMAGQRLMEDLSRRIDSGEDLFVEEVVGLTDSQKQVLIQRKQLVAQQRAMLAQPKVELAQTSKRGRRFGANKKDVAKREETRVEKPTPTSG
jgi:hypothetical protein